MIEISSSHELYYIDELGRIQGEFIKWYAPEFAKGADSLYSHQMYKDDKLHGFSRFYYYISGGMLDEDGMWWNGQRHGLSSYYHQSGEAEEMTYYKHGKRHGVSMTRVVHEDSAEKWVYQYFANNIDVTGEVEELVRDIQNITEKEEFILALRYGKVIK